MDRMIDINVRGTLAATKAALKHMQSGGRIVMIGSAVASVSQFPGWSPTRHEGSRKRCSLRAVQRGREPRYHGQQYPAGSDRHGLNPAAGDWAVPQKAATALNRYGRC